MTDGTAKSALVRHFRKSSFAIEVPLGGVEQARPWNLFRANSGVSASGLGDIRWNPIRRDRLEIAICVVETQFILVIGSRSFDLFDPRLVVARDTRFGMLKRCSIDVQGTRVLSIDYVWVDSFEDPLRGSRDILKYIAEIAWSRENKLRFFHTQRAILNGEDVAAPDVRARIDDAIESGVGVK